MLTNLSIPYDLCICVPISHLHTMFRCDSTSRCFQFNKEKISRGIFCVCITFANLRLKLYFRFPINRCIAYLLSVLVHCSIVVAMIFLEEEEEQANTNTSVDGNHIVKSRKILWTRFALLFFSVSYLIMIARGWRSF